MAKKDENVQNVQNEEKKEKMVALPVDQLNPKDKFVKVVINGNETKIERGKAQTVTEAVYERLVIAGYVVED